MKKQPRFNVKLTQVQPDGTSSILSENVDSIEGVYKIIENFFLDSDAVQKYLRDTTYENLLVKNRTTFVLIMKVINSGWETTFEVSTIF